MVNSLNDREGDRAVARQDPLARELHEADYSGNRPRRQFEAPLDGIYEVPTLMDRLDPKYEYYDLRHPQTGLFWHPVKIIDVKRNEG